MKSLHTRIAHHACTGFSLIELIVVIVVIGLSAAILLGLFGYAARTLGINEDAQTAAQLAQECSEHVLATKRNGTVAFAGIDNTICTTLPAFIGFTRTVTVTDAAGSPACTSASTGVCKQVVVQIAKSGNSLSETTLMLVNYP